VGIVPREVDEAGRIALTYSVVTGIKRTKQWDERGTFVHNSGGSRRLSMVVGIHSVLAGTDFSFICGEAALCNSRGDQSGNTRPRPGPRTY
jgi:hypothetical protein